MNDFLTPAIEKINEAIKFDDERKYKEAYNCYNEGLKKFIFALRCNIFYKIKLNITS